MKASRLAPKNTFNSLAGSKELYPHRTLATHSPAHWFLTERGWQGSAIRTRVWLSGPIAEGHSQMKVILNFHLGLSLRSPGQEEKQTKKGNDREEQFTFGEQLKCMPGTGSVVTYIVIHRYRYSVPTMQKNLLLIIDLEKGKNRADSQSRNSAASFT